MSLQCDKFNSECCILIDCLLDYLEKEISDETLSGEKPCKCFILYFSQHCLL